VVTDDDGRRVGCIRFGSWWANADFAHALPLQQDAHQLLPPMP
jgi:hypothetical protein